MTRNNSGAPEEYASIGCMTTSLPQSGRSADLPLTGVRGSVLVLGQKLVDDVAGDVGESELAAHVAVGEARVVEA